MPGSSTRIWLSPRPYFWITGSETPSLSMRSRIVSIDVSSVRVSRSRIADGFIVSVAVAVRRGRHVVGASSRCPCSTERASLSFAGGMPDTTMVCGRAGSVLPTVAPVIPAF